MGEETITVRTSPEKLRALIEPYLTQVTDMKWLKQRLYEILLTINPYFYELFLCVLNILTEIRELRPDVQQWGHILLFLKYKMVKKRERRVGQVETDWWIKKHGESAIMPKISKYRLPFLMVATEPLQDFLSMYFHLNHRMKTSIYFVNNIYLQVMWSQSKIVLNGFRWSDFTHTRMA